MKDDLEPAKLVNHAGELKTNLFSRANLMRLQEEEVQVSWRTARLFVLQPTKPALYIRQTFR